MDSSPISTTDLAREGGPGVPAAGCCIVILSHPRSGTHLLLDFIRRNFPESQPRLAPWESAGELYLSLDTMDRAARAAWLARHRQPIIIAQSHLLGFTKTPEDFSDVWEARRPLFFYPFRSYARTIKSYADFLAYKGQWDGRGTISGLLGKKDSFFGTSITIRECLEEHAQQCMRLNPTFINTELLIATPDEQAERIGIILDMTPASRTRRLPARRKFRGKWSEVFERLRGRESTEVIIPPGKCGMSLDEAKHIEKYFRPLYDQLGAMAKT